MARRTQRPAWDSVAALFPLPEAIQQHIVHGLDATLGPLATPLCIAEILHAAPPGPQASAEQSGAGVKLVLFYHMKLPRVPLSIA
jgi:hypothetical protein